MNALRDHNIIPPLPGSRMAVQWGEGCIPLTQVTRMRGNIDYADQRKRSRRLSVACGLRLRLHRMSA